MKKPPPTSEEVSRLLARVRERVPAAARALGEDMAGALVDGVTGSRPPGEILRSSGGKAVLCAGAVCFAAGFLVGRTRISPRAAAGLLAAASAGAVAGCVVCQKRRASACENAA